MLMYDYDNFNVANGLLNGHLSGTKTRVYK